MPTASDYDWLALEFDRLSAAVEACPGWAAMAGTDVVRGRLAQDLGRVADAANDRCYVVGSDLRLLAARCRRAAEELRAAQPGDAVW